MGAYKVWLDDDGIIKGILLGDQDKESTENVITEVNTLLSKENCIGSVLIDMSQTGRPSSESRRLHANNIRSNPKNLRKLALYGASTMNRVMANFIIKASGRVDMVRYFKTEKEAIEWLKEN